MALKRLLLVLLLLIGVAPAMAQSGPGASGHDPCTYAVKSSAPININGSGVTNLVSPLGSASVYVCSVNLTLSQAAFNSITFKSGTSAACAGLTALTGAIGSNSFVSSNVTAFAAEGALTLFAAPSGTGLCAVTTGGSAAFVEGFLTYVQQ